MNTDPTMRDGIGVLCVEGDHACAAGDLVALAGIARRLAERVHEPLHCRLIALADLCRVDPPGALAAWTELKDAIGWQLPGLPP